MVPRSRSWAYRGLMAAPGTPKACVTPSFSITSTAAIAAFILGMSISCDRRGLELASMLARTGPPRKTALAHFAYSMVE
jgi:hypothetical protein